MPVDLLTQLPFFKDLAAEQQQWLEPYFIPCEYEADTIIFNQGEQADYLYIILEGEVVVSFKPDDGPALIVARVLSGSVVGWSAALRSRLYTSTALTAVDTQMLRVRGSDLRAIYEQDAKLGQKLLDWLASQIAERLRSTHSQVLALLQLGLGRTIQTQEV